MIYTALCIMLCMRAYPLLGQVGGGWALEISSFLGPKWHSLPEVEITQRKKIHRLAYRFSIDFKIYRPAYGFLCVNHKDLAKVSRLLNLYPSKKPATVLQKSIDFYQNELYDFHLTAQPPPTCPRNGYCAAEAIFCCPTENSHHLKAWILSKNAQFHNENQKEYGPDVK
jgi:hypothetical protein